MPQTNKPTFSCPACGKHFAWKPEIAGKKAKCSCGSAVEVPLSIDPPPPEPEPEEDLIDFADNDPEPVAKRAPSGAAAAASAAGASECPICLETIPAGQHRCPSCGYDITKSGGKVHAAPAMAAGNAKGGVTAGMPGRTPVTAAAAAAAPHHESRIPQVPRRQMASAVQDTGPSAAVKVGLPVLAALVLVGAFFGFKHFQGGGHTSTDGKPLVGDDQDAVTMIHDDNGTEINEWLQTGRNHKIVMGMTLEQADGFGKARYAQGAKKVYAFAVVSTHLVVELPDDPAKRKGLIDNYNGWMKEHFARDPIKDIGQHYLIYKMHV